MTEPPRPATATIRFSHAPEADRLQAAVAGTFSGHPAARALLGPDGQVLADVLLHRSDEAYVLASLQPDRSGAILTLNPPAGSVDALGMRRLVHEIAARYRGESGPASPHDADAIADYLWDLLSQETGAAYWHHSQPAALRPAGLVTTLGIGMSSGSAGSVEVSLEPDTVRRLADMAGSTEAAFLGLFQMVVAGIATGPTAIGVYCAGVADEIADLIGATGRYVPCEVGAELTLPGHLAAAGRTLGDLKSMAEYRAIAAERYLLAYSCLATDDQADFGDIEAVAAYSVAPTGTIELQVCRQDGQPRLWLQYDDAVEETTIGWLAEALRDVAVSTAEAIGELKRFRGTELAAVAKVHIELNDLLARLQLFAQQQPDATAITDGHRSLSFRDLWSESGRLARRLREAGVERGTAVAVCLPRQLHLLPSLLAVWRAGGYFIPLDPEHPSGRHDLIIADSAPRVLIADAITSQRFEGSGLVVVRADKPGDAPSFAESAMGDQDVAYVLYTSGSTGVPKGVEISYGSLANYLVWGRDTYISDGGGGTILHSSIAVDLTVTSLFVALLAGQPVRLVPSGDVEDLARLISESRDLSYVKVTPSSLRILNHLVTPAQFEAAMRCLVVGGEQLYFRDVGQLMENSRQLVIINEYGPTETTVGSIAYRLQPGEVWPDMVPIGVPIRATTVRLMTSETKQCPDGLVGEIYIGGDGVAIGYRNRPEETAAKFVSTMGARWYRTGDSGRLRTDGQLEFLGRFDGQVKIHGFRLEPSEVEATLSAVPVVRDVAVILSKNAGSGYLSAFVVLEPGCDEAAAIAAVRSAAHDRLPAYARPDRYELLPQLPVAIGGKLDRRRLAELAAAPHAVHREAKTFDARDTNAVLAELWCTLLGCAKAQPDDSFFALGGDSVTALHFVSSARRAGIALSIRDVVAHRTFAAIARVAERDADGEGTPFEGRMPLSANQLLILGRGGAQIARWTLRWRFAVGDVDRVRLAKALASIARRHPAVRTVLAHDNGEWSATAAPIAAFQIPVHVANVSDESEEERAISVCESRMEMISPGLIRLCVLDYGKRSAPVLVWIAHHLVCDVVSLQILAQDLQAAYREGSRLVPDDGYVRWLAMSAAPSVRFPAPADGRTAVIGQPMRAIPNAVIALRHADGDRVAPIDVVAAAGLKAVSLWRGSSRLVAITVEGHGRSERDPDLTSSVGWLTSFQRLEASVAAGVTGRELLRTVRRAMVTPAHRTGVQLPSVALNYLGRLPSDRNVEGPGIDLGSFSTAYALFPIEMIGWLTADGFTAACRHVGDVDAAALLRSWDEAFAWLDRELSAAEGEQNAEFDDVSADDLDRIMSQLDLP